MSFLNIINYKRLFRHKSEKIDSSLLIISKDKDGNIVIDGQADKGNTYPYYPFKFKNIDLSKVIIRNFHIKGCYDSEEKN